MEIIGENQQTGNPIFNVGEYKDVLQMEQTLNCDNISNYVKATLNKADSKELNTAIEHIFRQPIMAGVYRKNGLKPEYVDEYIESRKQQPMGPKISMMLHLGVIYNSAAKSMEEEINKPRISGYREWLSLEVAFNSSDSATLPMKSFVGKKSAEEKTSQPQKTRWQKIVQMIKNSGRKF